MMNYFNFFFLVREFGSSNFLCVKSKTENHERMYLVLGRKGGYEDYFIAAEIRPTGIFSKPRTTIYDTSAAKLVRRLASPWSDIEPQDEKWLYPQSPDRFSLTIPGEVLPTQVVELRDTPEKPYTEYLFPQASTKPDTEDPKDAGLASHAGSDA